MPVESEIKLIASPAMLARLRGGELLAPGEGTVERTAVLATTWFDTAAGALARAGAMLRIRDDGAGTTQTLKIPLAAAPGISRAEWNAAARSDRPDQARFPNAARKALHEITGGAPLGAVATARIERTTRRIRHGGSLIEAAFDCGTITAGGREEPVCELELELVSGRSLDLLMLARELPLGDGLMWSLRSKAERASALASGQAPAATRAGPVALAAGMTAAEGFQVIAWDCLRQLVLNYPLIVATGDPDAVHQSRVAVRRLRTALSLFADIADDAERGLLTAELRAVTVALGVARDVHVLLERIAPVAGAAGDTGRELLEHLGQVRDAGTRSAAAMCASAAFQHLLFQLATWIEGGGWLTDPDNRSASQPLVHFASRALSRRHRKLRRAKEPLKDLSTAGRHRLRIAAKKLRYAVEFFAALDAGGRGGSKALAKSLGGLQDSLGVLNDMAIVVDRADLFAQLEPIAAARLTAELASLGAGQRSSRRRLLKAAQRQLDSVRDCRRWWKDGQAPAPVMGL